MGSDMGRSSERDERSIPGRSLSMTLVSSIGNLLDCEGFMKSSLSEIANLAPLSVDISGKTLRKPGFFDAILPVVGRLPGT